MYSASPRSHHATVGVVHDLRDVLEISCVSSQRIPSRPPPARTLPTPLYASSYGCSRGRYVSVIMRSTSSDRYMLASCPLICALYLLRCCLSEARTQGSSTISVDHCCIACHLLFIMQRWGDPNLLQSAALSPCIAHCDETDIDREETRSTGPTPWYAGCSEEYARRCTHRLPAKRSEARRRTGHLMSRRRLRCVCTYTFWYRLLELRYLIL